MKLTQEGGNRELPPQWLLIAWLALPQIAETILAPALPDLARVWRLNAAHAQWVMGVFFMGFSVGVFLWGQVSDRLGRRPALLLGLAIALVGTIGASLTADYRVLLMGRFVQAIGMATCSITTQTILRDRLAGDRLTRYFVTLGVVVCWSPAVGPLVGQIVSDSYGYRGALWVTGILVALLVVCGAVCLDETRPQVIVSITMKRIALQMMIDRPLWCAAVLVAGLNLLVFSFYAAGPFMVGPLPGLGFGWIGLAVALAGSFGAACNRRLSVSISSERRVRYGLLGVFAGVMSQLLFVLITGHSGVLWAITALPVFAGFGLAIPNILAPTLRNYGTCLGSAGALFGLTYYLLLGAALSATTALRFETPVPLCYFWAVVATTLLTVHLIQTKGLRMTSSLRSS